MEPQNNKIVLFQSRKVRRIWYQKEWYFSVIDIVMALTDTPSPRQYWSVLKTREPQLLTICLQLKLESMDRKFYLTDCVTTKNAFRLIQSIPSKKAEPFKMWLAQVGQERLEEIENPELAQERMKLLYEKKGYPKNWIDKRLRSIAVRQDLTDEWKARGAADRDYAILTAEISKATFGMTPSQYKKHKNLPSKSKINLRDHMDDLELILTMLGEATTTRLTRDRNSKGFPKLKIDANDGGKVAGRTRRDIESRSGKRVVTKKNYLILDKPE